LELYYFLFIKFWKSTKCCEWLWSIATCLKA